MAAGGIAAVGLVVARVLFGGVIAFMGLNHFLNRETMTGYAASKGFPAPGLAVAASGAVLVAGGAAVALGAFAVVGALAVAGFLLSAALLMHDFWAVPEDEVQTDLTQFLKNVALAGGALAIAVLATRAWAFSLGVGLF